jgi:26S proteasome regulatory subunit, ATPase 3, interacting protein
LFVHNSQIDPEEYSKLQQIRDGYLQEYNKRKRLCMNMIDAILEGYQKSKQKLIEDTEIETDEAAGFNINQYK